MIELIDARAYVADAGAGRFDLDPAQILGIAWHHTAAFYPAAHLTVEDEINHIRMIDAYHISQGYLVFGYHGIAFASGRAYVTGSLRRARSHVASRNHQLIGFCVAGLFTHSTPPDDALRALALLRTRAYGVHLAWAAGWAELGHTDWALPQYPTTCPGDQRAAWIPRIATISDTEEDSEMKVVMSPEDGAIYVLYGPGKRHIDDIAEAEVYLAATNQDRPLTVSKARLDMVPTVQ